MIEVIYFCFKDRTAAGLSVFVTQEPKGEKCSCGHLGGFLWKFQQLNNHYTPLFIKKEKKKLWQSYNLKVFLSEISSVKHNTRNNGVLCESNSAVVQNKTA